LRIGEFQLDVVSGGPFRLDGGSMFGIIPKPLWEPLCRPDERNRIPLETNCAVIRGGGEVVVVDTGNGTKLGEKEQEIYALDPSVTLPGSLARLGIHPDDVTRVVYTHLHMDHAGGGTTFDPAGRVVPTFPKACYHVQRVEWEDACANRSTMRVSYRPENLRPLQESGQLQLLDGDAEIFPGLRAHVTGGHTAGHQILFLESQGTTAVLFGDLVPTTAHLRGPCVMAYDLYPYDTMRRKIPLIAQAAREGWTIGWDHDPTLPLGRILDAGNGKYRAIPCDGAGA
jgi:glyoxylase-like metal-dependent hydrolase (beta-lactamase superfamily II)